MINILLLSLLTLLLSCGSQEATGDVAGFGSETTNGIVISVAGLSSPDNISIRALPSNFNPVTDNKSEIFEADLNDEGKAVFNLEKGKSFSFYATDDKSGKKFYIPEVISSNDTLIEAELTETGEIQVNFINSADMLDSSNGYLYIAGYPEFVMIDDQFSRQDSVTSVTITEVPEAIINSLNYSVKGNNDEERLLSDSVEVEAGDTTEVEARFYYRFMNTTNSPLMSDTVTTVTLGEEDGIVWIATLQGMMQYIDNTFYKYMINSAIITSICESSDSVTWFGTTLGISRFASGNWSNYNLNNSNFLLSEVVTAMTSARDGYVAVGTDKGLMIWGPTAADNRNITIDNSGISSEFITTLAVDCTGTIIAGTLDGFFEVHKDGRIKIFDQKVIGGSTLPNPKITDIEVTSNNEIWIGTAASGVIIHKDNSGTPMPFPDELWELNATAGLCEDSKGNMWVGTSTGHILVFKDNIWYEYLDDNMGKLPGAEITGVTVDDNDNLYFGTVGKGLFLFGPDAENLFLSELAI